MPKNINVSYLGDVTKSEEADDRPVMVQVSNVSMVFNIANERLNSLKEYFIALMRHQLRFREFYALDDVSFEVRKGDVFGILGTNGSGKSTMLKIVAGVLEPTKGEVDINGGVAPLIELGAGFDYELTARENIFLNGALLGYPRSFINEHFDEIVDFAEIRDFLDMPLKNYSSGMVARIAFSIATMIVPEILIVDEVLSVGDFMFQQKCEQRISDLIKNHGVTVLIVSHSNDQIERLCNKAIWIEKGHTRMMGDAGDVCRAYRIVGGRTGSEQSEKRVIDMMMRRYQGVHKVLDTIYGDTRFSTAVLAAERYIDKQKRLIMVGGDAQCDCMMATSLAGLLDAVVLNTLSDMLPMITNQTIKGIAPEEIFIVGEQSQVGEEVRAKLSEQVGGREVLRFGDASVAARSLDIYEYGKTRQGGWGDTAVLACPDALIGTISLAPLLYEAAAPIFYAHVGADAAPAAAGGDAADAGEQLNERIAQALGQGFSRVVTVEWPTPLPASLVEALGALEQAGVEVVRFASPDVSDMNQQINAWIDRLRAADGLPPIDNIVVAQTWSPVDTYLVGPFASKSKSQVLLYSPVNLDEVTRAFDYLDAKGGVIERMTFLGNSVFNADDREVIAKALLFAKGAEQVADQSRPGMRLHRIAVYEDEE